MVVPSAVTTSDDDSLVQHFMYGRSLEPYHADGSGQGIPLNLVNDAGRVPDSSDTSTDSTSSSSSLFNLVLCFHASV